MIIPNNLLSLQSGSTTISDKDVSVLLQERFAKDQFYTRVGHATLLAVNPNKRIFIPSHKAYDLERICQIDNETEPHPFDIASGAYLHMVRACEDQAIVTSGESGSGKSEVLRQVLQQIIHLSQQTDPQTKVHADVLDAEMILECFGNAETAQNKNSTRYSRYTELRFNDEGTMVGSRIVEYLFESSRVSKCPEDEHNFHIFYMMLASGSKEEKSRWQLHGVDTKAYHFLKSESVLREKGVSMVLPKLEDLKTKLKNVGLSRRQILELFNLLAGILHLGNIEFTMEEQGKGYGAYVKNRTELQVTAKLFHVDPEKLEASLTTATYVEDDVVCSAFLDVDKSKETRDAFAAVMYKLVFKWLIEQINVHLGSQRLGGAFGTVIGLLDICGFEDRSPKPNGFDQFMSNYANEKIQAFVFKRTQQIIPKALENDGVKLNFLLGLGDDFAEDGIVSFYEDGPKALFTVINTETQTHGERARDSTILALFEMQHQGDSPFYLSGKGGWSTFQIRHFSSTRPVSYNAHGFVQRNRNAVTADILTLFSVTVPTTTGSHRNNQQQKSEKTFAASLFLEALLSPVTHPKDKSAVVAASVAAPAPPSHHSDPNRSHSHMSSLSASSMLLLSTQSVNVPPPKRTQQSQQPTALAILKSSTDDLLSAIQEMRLWNIVCIKPNADMSAEKMDAAWVLNQLQCQRVSQLVRSGKIDYSVGIEFSVFADRFSCAIDWEKTGGSGTFSETARGKCEEFCRRIAKGLFTDGRCGSAVCGQSRIFLGEGEWRWLEKRVDSATRDDNEEVLGRKIHLVFDDLGIQRTPLGVKKSLESLQEREPHEATKKEVEDGLIHDPDKTQSVLASKESLKDKEKAKEMEDEDAKKKSPRSCFRPRQKLPKEKMSKNRRNWVLFTFCVTWWIPDCVIETLYKKTQPSTVMAWREKVAICFIVGFLSAIMLFFVQGLGKILCPNQYYFSPDEVALHSQNSGLDKFVSYNGYVFDITGFAHPGGLKIAPVSGSDISGYFPRGDPRTGVPLSSSCSQIIGANPSSQSAQMRRDVTYTVYDNDTNALCTSPSVPNTPGFCHDTSTINYQIKTGHINVQQIGVLAYGWPDIKAHYTPDDWWVCVENKIYNMSPLTAPNSTLLLSTDYSLDWLGGVGNADATANATFLKDNGMTACFDDFLLVGFLDQRAPAARCQSSAYILYGVTGIMVAIMVVKFLAALQLAPSPNPEDCDRFVIMQVPCYNEGEASLTKTIESLATFDYDDTRKLLFIVSDGVIKSAGSDLSTPDIVLQILGVDKRLQQPEAKSYLAIGRGLKEHNKAKVYSGLYCIHARYIPFIFVMKVGREGETSKPGNRGKRDSQMILMKFLNRVNFGTPMSPLELEMYHHIKNVIGVDPFLYEYCLMVDADTRCDANALNRLISCMVNDSNTMGICGETRIENENESWVTMMQVYEYYISHHMAKAFESLFGSVTCLPGCFCMYRLRTPKKIPLLISNQILNEYKDINVNTLHKQNLLSLGEDRFLTTLMLKHFPEYRNKFTPDAVCYTIVPDTFSMLLGQRRRWINSTIHNLFELIFLPTLCGCLCFSLRLVVFLDLFATLIMPAATAYLVYLIYASVESQQAPIISLIMMASAFGLQAIIFLFKGQYQHIGWMIISILAMPVFSFYIPLYAYWHFDDFKWGNTRKGAAADTGAGHGGSEDEELIPLEVGVVPLVTWEAHEAAMALKVEDVKPPPAAYQSSAKGTGASSQFLGVPTAGRSVQSIVAPASSMVSVSAQGADRWVMQSVEVLPKWGGGQPSDDDIAKYVRYLISTTDLSQLSKKKVREAVNAYFGMDLSAKRTFINDVVEVLIQS